MYLCICLLLTVLVALQESATAHHQDDHHPPHHPTPHPHKRSVTDLKGTHTDVEHPPHHPTHHPHKRSVTDVKGTHDDVQHPPHHPHKRAATDAKDKDDISADSLKRQARHTPDANDDDVEERLLPLLNANHKLIHTPHPDFQRRDGEDIFLNPTDPQNPFNNDNLRLGRPKKWYAGTGKQKIVLLNHHEHRHMDDSMPDQPGFNGNANNLFPMGFKPHHSNNLHYFRLPDDFPYNDGDTTQRTPHPRPVFINNLFSGEKIIEDVLED